MVEHETTVRHTGPIRIISTEELDALRSQIASQAEQIAKLTASHQANAAKVNTRLQALEVENGKLRKANAATDAAFFAAPSVISKLRSAVIAADVSLSERLNEVHRRVVDLERGLAPGADPAKDLARSRFLGEIKDDVDKLREQVEEITALPRDTFGFTVLSRDVSLDQAVLLRARIDELTEWWNREYVAVTDWCNREVVPEVNAMTAAVAKLTEVVERHERKLQGTESRIGKLNERVSRHCAPGSPSDVANLRTSVGELSDALWKRIDQIDGRVKDLEDGPPDSDDLDPALSEQRPNTDAAPESKDFATLLDEFNDVVAKAHASVDAYLSENRRNTDAERPPASPPRCECHICQWQRASQM